MTVGRTRAETTVAIGGLGAIGGTLARRLDAGVPGLRLAAVSARDRAKAEERIAALSRPVPVLPLGALAEAAEIVVECCPAALLAEIAEPALKAGRKLVVSSVGALMGLPHLVDLAAEHGGQIMVPTGALIGLDAVTAAAEGTIHSVRMVTRKPVKGLLGAPYLTEHGIDLSRITEPTRVFQGTAREAARGFPANLNVAVALGLAGIGPERTMLEIWADPGLDRNTHEIEVEADSARFSMRIAGIPTAENPRTGRITALSVLALLRKLHQPLRVGT